MLVLCGKEASGTSGRLIARGSGKKYTISPEDQLLITMMRLWQGGMENELA